MAALTCTELQDELARVLKTGARSGDDIRTSFARWINQACRLIAYSYPWDERRGEQRVQTVDTYETGTATFTRASATVTGSGTTWVSGMIGRKIALSIGSPPYRVTAVGSTTSLTIADTYAETTASASAYVMFQDEFDLLSATHSVEKGVIFQGTWSGPLVPAEQSAFEGSDTAGYSSGRPLAYCIATSTTVGTPRIRVLPVPDDIYRLSFRYLKTWTDIATSDVYTTQGLPVDVEELIIDRALRWAPRIDGARRVMTDREWREELRKVWVAHSKRKYKVGQRQGVVSRSGPSIVFNASGL